VAKGSPTVNRLSVGTSGWSYPSWRPGFYPAGLDPSGFLAFYAERFSTVELNTTGYRLPGEEQFRRWAEQVPDGFEFAPKLPGHRLRGLDEFAARGMANFGAFILGRNMFGPVRGPWPDNSWRGWWGDNPPYHAPTFVLTHYERAPLVMDGGTTFHFVTGGIEEALKLARQAAGDKDVKIGGGVSTVRQYLQANLIDSLHFALSPVVLGQGEALFTGLDLRALGFIVTEHKATEHATHLVLERG